jgi:hypothetical protein
MHEWHTGRPSLDGEDEHCSDHDDLSTIGFIEHGARE